MFSTSALLSAFLGLLARWLSTVTVQEVDRLRAEAAQREIGAGRQAQGSELVAQAQEARARAAVEVATDGPDDPADILPETKA